MNISVKIQSITLHKVFSLNQGTKLIRGGKKSNPDVFKPCKTVNDRFICYYWKGLKEIFYVGSISKDYKNNHNNLTGRISNYLQNHAKNNTNKNVFDNVNKLIQSEAIEFGIFKFDVLEISGKQIDYNTCSNNADLIYMIENILIGVYKNRNECTWNK